MIKANGDIVWSQANVKYPNYGGFLQKTINKPIRHFSKDYNIFRK